MGASRPPFKTKIYKNENYENPRTNFTFIN